MRRKWASILKKLSRGLDIDKVVETDQQLERKVGFILFN